jgi:small-conductance mechanosensitive channel
LRACTIFRRSASLALLVGLVATIPLLHDAPQGVKGMVDLLGAWIVVRLLLPRLTPPFRKMLLALMASILTWEVIKLFQFPDWIERDLLLVFGVSFAALLWWLSRQARRSEVPLTRPQRVALLGVRVALFLIVVSVLANIAGYHGLADLLVRGTLVSAYRAITLYTVVVVGSAIASWGLHVRATRRLSSFNTDASRLVRRVSITLGSVILGVWLHTALNLFTIRESVYGAIRAALTYRIAIGSVGFSLSNIVAFALTLFFGYLLAAVLRIILGEEVLPRLKLGRGLPLAIATVTHYVVLFLIFLLALAAAGVELSRFTLLTGALGVGLGFGLQNVVNNFVSGLILLFERPVRVGDLLEIGGISGEVTKLGFRSSTLHAFDGSDLIIPNADLISQKVINWTFSGTLRQILLKVDVAHGSDPRRVRDLLLETVVKQPGVPEHPKANALFLGHGDTAMNFEVRFWAPRPEVVAELRSDVALSISAALADAGIKLPKRDLHIRGMEPAAGVKEPVVPQGH